MTAFEPYEILRVLEAHEVAYVVVGGFAAVAYGSPLPTTDIDITPDPEMGNLGRLSEALRDLDAKVRVAGVPEGLAFEHDAQMLSQQVVLHLVTRAGALDLVLQPDGVGGYAELAASRRLVTVRGVSLPLASLADVVRSKEAAGRPKDRSALPVLRALLARLADP